ncbi:tyrosyl-tRNA synthetase [Spirochaeta isovalerica]|uniref:Tyrosine--tRNA ligase n=1 Tax=Spirochaeta isovalerica TaxID=150 RepID=A0A841R535_9SPIO|nr:tyrosyl-tRNA synthetase [Spirochaeta isovalerica]
MNALDVLKERGFFKQCTDEEMLLKKLEAGPTRIYVGVDPTGPSMHIGHMVPLFAMHHLQKAGHLPIILVGGGTARIGDPSGKSDMRKMQTVEEIQSNAEKLKEQISRFISFEEGGAKLVDNAEWLAPLNYIEFLRDIGRHFSVNRMLTFEAYKLRLEKGLSFIEFNYQLLQSYDFLELYRRENCILQIGGDDQWGNIVAGMELIRRVEGGEAMGLTFPLVTRSDGKKMGKTEKGAVFLDSSMTSVYDFFQYWRNVDDADVEKFLLMYTFLPVEECKRLGALEGQEINKAKEVLAYEQTKIIHGKEEADKALAAAHAAFTSGGADDKSGMPSKEMAASDFSAGINILELFSETALCSSKSEARRLVMQNGASVNGDKINNPDALIDSSMIVDGELILKAGKKRFFRIIVK